VAGHGSSSPWDVHNTLIAAGPDLKAGLTIDTPSGNVDFAPTLLTLLGAAIPSSMEGRPLEEAFVTGKPLNADAVSTREQSAATADGAYTVTGTYSILRSGGREYRYFDQARAVRK
jgi:arylsulfatase A-like enzyme